MTKTFEELYRLDVTEHIEKKANLSYLSWAWAHAEMKKADPDAKITVHEFPEYIAIGDTVQTIYKPYLNDNGGAWVKVSVEMNGRLETEYLPIMDFKNKSVTNPDSMSVNKAIKRCFVKALALHGLGLHIYAGEDLPESEPPKPATTIQIKALTKEIERMAELAGIAYEKAEKGILTHLNIAKKLKDITNEEYGTMLGYINKMIPVYEKKVAEKKATEQAAHQDAQVEQVGMDMQYNIPEK